MRRQLVCGVMWWLGCSDGSAYGFGFGPVDPASLSGSSYCEPTLDTPTPLGITGADLLRLYAGEFDVELVQRQLASGEELTAPEPVHVSVAHRPQDSADAGSCGVLSLPVTVSMRGPRLELSEVGTLAGTASVGQITFGSERVSFGRITSQQGTRTVELVIQNEAWSTGGQR
ncbi:MAG: hypothetical protein ABW352_10545 [Polyangiales bacterium]